MLPFLLNPQDATQALGIALILIGVVGVFIPVLPGPLMIWIGALVWAYGDGFKRVGWPVLLAMGVIVIAAWGSNLAMTTYFTRRSSASWKTVAGAVIGGIVGGALLTFGIPVIGSVIGAVIGGVSGVLLVELLRHRQLRPALHSGVQYLVGCVFGQMVELMFALAMLLLFVWQATR
ncbi:MAG: DUF456 domain-containing protein [Thermoflexales bacterium]|nr:DUF456 domain-containing protein [Thermoflexales bacterium]MDW8351087.1 DUF456 domain-containing protein [Anaerolineae bacterium]